MQPKKETQPINLESEKARVEAVPLSETSPEVESWMEKIEKKFARVPNKTVTPMDDSVVVQNPQADQPPVTLPVTAAQVQVGKKAPVEEGIAWLVAWVVRQWKQLTKKGRKVRLQDLPEADK